MKVSLEQLKDMIKEEINHIRTSDFEISQEDKAKILKYIKEYEVVLNALKGSLNNSDVIADLSRNLTVYYINLREVLNKYL